MNSDEDLENNRNRAADHELAYLKACAREEAERRRRQIQKRVAAMAEITPKSRLAASKAFAREVHAKIDDIAAQADLNAVETNPGFDHTGAPSSSDKFLNPRIDDFDSLFSIREKLPAWLQERIKKIYGKINWMTRDGQKAYFNIAVHNNGIPIHKALSILAHVHGAHDGTGRSLDSRIDAVIECGLFPKIKKGKFTYTQRCQDNDHCNLCNYLNISDGLKELLVAYSTSAFNRAGNFFAITVAPRAQSSDAKAIGRILTPDDWNSDNSNSAVYQESFHNRVFQYLAICDSEESHDWAIESASRAFLGAAQFCFGKLVKNCWVDGIRAKVENSVEFLPFVSHHHWHAVASSTCEHAASKMAEFMKHEIDGILSTSYPGLFADVLVAQIPSSGDLTRWIKYMHKTVDLIRPVESVYNRHPDLLLNQLKSQELRDELALYVQRTHRLFGMARCSNEDERGRHTYALRRRYVRGTHKFGKGSILSESTRHRLWRMNHSKKEAERKARARK